MTRTTNKLLENLIQTLNEVNGLPTEPHDSEAKEYSPNPLNLHLESVNNYYKLAQMARSGSGERNVSNGYTKKELEIFLRGMIAQTYIEREIRELKERGEWPY